MNTAQYAAEVDFLRYIRLELGGAIGDEERSRGVRRLREVLAEVTALPVPARISAKVRERAAWEFQAAINVLARVDLGRAAASL